MNDFEQAREELVRSTMDKIIEHGHQVTYVFPTPEDPGIPFGYTIGRTLKGRPELLLTGPLPPEAVQGILNTACARDDEEPLEAGQSREDILQGYSVRIIAADPEAAQMKQALAFFGDDVTALQVLWPDIDGFFPGEEPYEAAHPDDIQPTYEPSAELVDTSSSASRQHYIDTGEYLTRGTVVNLADYRKEK